VRALRKPPVSAWALNVLAAEEPELLGELLEVGERLREAQSEGEADAIRSEGGRRRSLLSNLVTKGERILRAGGHVDSGGTVQRLRRSLEALALLGPSSEAARGLGTHDGDLEPPSFEQIFGDTPPTAVGRRQASASAPASAGSVAPRAAAQAASSERPRARDVKAAQRAERVRRAAANLAFAEQRLVAAQAAAEEADEAEAVVRREVERLEAEAEAVRARWREAQDRAGAARRGLKAAAVSRERAQAEVARLGSGE
jgi:flagellar biosynthesis GTPase FlhF